ncbi:MAG TPA: class I SAM-dependent methyltransferase [Gaiellaceae bacterium]|nr:class I SAM-dependent methyltransferase [Gaiellaceae bacterium]
MERDAWNAAAHEWVGRIREGMGGRVHAHDASLYELLPPPSGLTLDAGCGEGRLTRELASRGYDVIGVDASEALVAEARSAHPDGRYEVATIDVLPVADGAVELVVCVNVLPHVHDLGTAAAELARVLAPGGMLLIGTIHPVAHAGTYDEGTGELRIRDYYDREREAVPLGEHTVHHERRTFEDYLRTLLGAGFALSDFREVAGQTGKLPLYLDLLLTRS